MSAIEARDVFMVHSTDEGEAAALQGLSLDVHEGELLVVFGPSGSGKTSFLRALAGLVRPSSGRLTVFGEDLTKMNARRLVSYRTETLGYLDQHYWRVLSPEITVRELIGLQLALRGQPAAAWRRRADDLLSSVGLRDKATAHVDTLSGGEQQRVALCAALTHHPRVLLADEPTGELDAATAVRVYGLTRELTKAIGCTTVLVTHDLRWREIADRVVRIRDGRVTEEISAHAGGRETLVIDDRGWVRIPEDARLRSGVTARLEIEVVDGAIVLRRTSGEATTMRAPAGGSTGGQELGHAPDTPLAQPTSAAVSVSDVSKAFGDDIVLKGLSAEFQFGSFHVVTGPSGCGKTTLLRVIAGMEEFDTGEVVTAGRSLATMTSSERAALRRTDIAYVSQQSMLIERLTARENIELGLSVRGLGNSDSVAAALEQVGLGARGDHRLRRLSVGERARVALARALAANPRVIIVDEPTSRLDESNMRLVAAVLSRIAHDQHTCVICSTHDPAVVAFADESLSLASM